MLIEWDVPIEMDDGIVLRADVFRPTDGGPNPVLLSHGPYGKGLAFQEGYPDQWKIMVRNHPEILEGSTNKYQNWEVADPEKLVPHGYVCVRVDSRGAGRSPGFLDPFSPRETKDFYNCIEWAGTQPWSTGRVGLLGISYYAINQWQVASLQPPHLAAICPWEGAADWYRDMTHHGGILSTFWANWYVKQVLAVQHGLGDRGPVSAVTGELVSGPATSSAEELAANRAQFGHEILSHPFDNSYFRERSAVWSRIEVPILSAANWGGQGLHLRGNFEGFLNAASKHKWLEVHGREHWVEFYTDYGVDLQKRFFDHFLKDEQNGWEMQPRVQLQVRTIGGFIERLENEWPLARTDWTRLYLDSAREELASVAPEGASVGFEAMGKGVTFWAPPQEVEIELTGPIASKLFISSSTPDADLFLIFRVFSPDGEEVVFQGAIDPHTPVAQGWLRASHRGLDQKLSMDFRPFHPHHDLQPLVAGEIYEVDVEVWPTSIMVPKGYRLALTIQGKDYECEGEGSSLQSFENVFTGCGPFLHDDSTDRSNWVFQGRTTIHGGGDRCSYLLLPFVRNR